MSTFPLELVCPEHGERCEAVLVHSPPTITVLPPENPDEDTVGWRVEQTVGVQFKCPADGGHVVDRAQVPA